MLVSIGHEQPDGILEHVLNDLVPGLSPGMGSPSLSLGRIDAAEVLARVAALTAACRVRSGQPTESGRPALHQASLKPTGVRKQGRGPGCSAKVGPGLPTPQTLSYPGRGCGRRGTHA